MNTKKLVLSLLVIKGLLILFFEVKYFNIPYWIMNLQSPEIYDVSLLLRKFFNYFAIVGIALGILDCLKTKKISLNNFFSYPIYYFSLKTLLFLIGISITANVKVINYVSTERLFNVIFLVIVIYHFAFNLKSEHGGSNYVSVKKMSRLKNWVIDLVHIIPLYFVFITPYSQGRGSFNIEYFNSNHYILFTLYVFVYYFFSELVFLQTIGKLHNSSWVTIEKSRFSSTLKRTLSRFIPFEPFSFLANKNGWHDKFSGTKITIANKTYE